MRTILNIPLLLNCVSCINSVCCVLSIHMYMQYFPSVLQVCGHCPQLQASLAVLNSCYRCSWECGGHCHLSQEGGEQVTLFTSQWTRLYIMPSACLGEGSVTYSTQILQHITIIVIIYRMPCNIFLFATKMAAVSESGLFSAESFTWHGGHLKRPQLANHSFRQHLQEHH